MRPTKKHSTTDTETGQKQNIDRHIRKPVLTESRTKFKENKWNQEKYINTEHMCKFSMLASLLSPMSTT